MRWTFDNVSFHLTDRCNLRCQDCHWFSGAITEPDKIPSVDDYLSWIDRWGQNFHTIRLTGGEPTMYSDFVDLVNLIPTTHQLLICTNGTNLPALAKINRPVNLLVSENRPVWDGFENSIKKLGHPVSFVTYLDGGWLRNQLLDNISASSLVSCQGKCQPQYIRFGSDGYAYQCEIGLRSKNVNLRSGFSLWTGEPTIKPIRCIARSGCLSNFVGENFFSIESAQHVDNGDEIENR